MRGVLLSAPRCPQVGGSSPCAGNIRKRPGAVYRPDRPIPACGEQTHLPFAKSAPSLAQALTALFQNFFKSPRKACATHPTFQNIRAWPLGCEGEAQGGRAENLDCSPVWLKEPSLSLLPGDLTAVDLFSGAGGFSLGLEMAGFRPLMGLDLMRAARDTYLANFPQAGFLLADAREVPAKELLALLSGRRPTVVTAGVPCQGFSLLGKRNPEDERNYLFLELLRFVEALEPEAVLVENVPAMGRTRSARLGTSFAEGVRRALEALGYQVEHQELLAADYGVPQMRRRLFFVALRPGSPFAWPEPPCQEPVTVWEAIGDLPPWPQGRRPGPTPHRPTPPTPPACGRGQKNSATTRPPGTAPLPWSASPAPRQGPPSTQASPRGSASTPTGQAPPWWREGPGPSTTSPTPFRCGGSPCGRPPGSRASPTALSSSGVRCKRGFWWGTPCPLFWPCTWDWPSGPTWKAGKEAQGSPWGARSAGIPPIKGGARACGARLSGKEVKGWDTPTTGT